jgi:hypothetical protein
VPRRETWASIREAAYGPLVTLKAEVQLEPLL